MSRIAALVLAAGLSRRMAPAQKLLEPFGGRSVLATTLAHLDASTVDDILVIVGHDAARVSAETGLAVARARIVKAHRHADGISATLAAGLSQVRPDADGVLICLADMPLVRSETIDALLAAFRASTAASPIVAPVHDRIRGNPVIWHRAHLAALARLDGDEGGRSLLGRHPSDLVPVDTGDAGVLVDIDTRDALLRARATLARST